MCYRTEICGRFSAYPTFSIRGEVMEDGFLTISITFEDERHRCSVDSVDKTSTSLVNADRRLLLHVDVRWLSQFARCQVVHSYWDEFRS